MLRADRGLGPLRRRGDRRACPPNRVCHKGIGRTYQIPRPFRNLTLLENVALSAWFGQDGNDRRAPPAGARPRRRWRWSGCRPTRARPPTGSAPPRSRSSSWRARSRRSRKLLLADESLNGLDHARDGAGGRHAAAHPRGEGHHHRLGRAHHGRADARGRPRGGARPRREDLRGRARRRRRRTARVVEVYLGADAAAWMLAARLRHRRGLRRLPGAVRRLHATSRPARRWP